jgi:hypothetical protein
MPSPCNNLNVIPIKVSQLVRYKNIDVDDFLLTIESGSGLYSRKSTFGDLVDALGNVTGSYTGSFSGSFSGSFKGKSSGSFSGSYWGSVISKNTKATGSFNGKTSGSFSGSILSKNTKATGSFYGNKSNISGSFSGSFYGSLLSKTTKASGSFSGSFYGSLLSKNTKASGSFSGSHYGSLLSKNTKASGSFSGSHYGKVIGSNGSLITGSFRGIDNITNFKGTGKKVSFNGTSSYAVSASYALTASYLAGVSVAGDIFANASYNQKTGANIPVKSGTSNVFGAFGEAGKKIKWFKIEGSFNVGENDYVILNGVTFKLYGEVGDGTLLTSNIYSSWGWQNGYSYNPDGGTIRTHFTIEGAPPTSYTGGQIILLLWAAGSYSCQGYSVGYY